MQDNNTVQCDERTLEHGFEKVKITHIPDMNLLGQMWTGCPLPQVVKQAR